MAILKTKLRMTLASQLVINNTNSERIRSFNDDVLRLLPQGSRLVSVIELPISPSMLSTDYEVTYDCPFFTNDFEFDVHYLRTGLSDGNVLHMTTTATHLEKI